MRLKKAGQETVIKVCLQCHSTTVLSLIFCKARGRNLIIDFPSIKLHEGHFNIVLNLKYEVELGDVTSVK